MNMRRAFFSARAPLAVAIAAGLGWWAHTSAQTAAVGASAPTAAFDTTAAPSTALVSSTYRTAASGLTTTTETSTAVPFRGAVGGSPEAVTFSGPVRVNTKVVTDPDFLQPATVVLSVDLSSVVGTGTLTAAKYTTASQYIIQRPLAAADSVQVVFPFASSGGTARQGVATIIVGFDPTTGKLTRAAAVASTQ